MPIREQRTPWGKTMNDQPTEKPIELQELYKLAASTRQFELQMLWQRSNYLLILNTAIAGAYFSQRGNSHSAMLPIVGFSAALLWLLMTLGGKYWQARWEGVTRRLEEKLIGNNPKLFSADWTDIDADVQDMQNRSRTHEQISAVGYRRCAIASYRCVLDSWQAIVNRGILLKPSVTQVMIFASLLFMAFWVFAPFIR
jgi:hypothetical protein